MGSTRTHATSSINNTRNISCHILPLFRPFRPQFARASPCVASRSTPAAHPFVSFCEDSNAYMQEACPTKRTQVRLRPHLLVCLPTIHLAACWAMCLPISGLRLLLALQETRC